MALIHAQLYDAGADLQLVDFAEYTARLWTICASPMADPAADSFVGGHGVLKLMVDQLPCWIDSEVN